MFASELIKQTGFEQLSESRGEEKQLKGVFCCDLLSHAMAKLPEDYAWITVMANNNTLAVATLTEAACVILAQGLTVEQALIDKANEKNVVLLRSEQPIFETAKLIDGIIHG